MPTAAFTTPRQRHASALRTLFDEMLHDAPPSSASPISFRARTSRP